MVENVYGCKIISSKIVLHQKCFGINQSPLIHEISFVILLFELLFCNFKIDSPFVGYVSMNEDLIIFKIYFITKNIGIDLILKTRKTTFRQDKGSIFNQNLFPNDIQITYKI